MWCMNNKRGTAVVVHDGPDAVTSWQFISTHACTAIGIVLVVLFISGFLFWFAGGAMITVIAAIAALLSLSLTVKTVVVSSGNERDCNDCCPCCNDCHCHSQEKLVSDQ